MLDTLTAPQLHTLRHMLGVNDPFARVPACCRNYAAVNPGDPEYLELERIGAVEQFKANSNTGYDWYRCTEEGRSAAIKSCDDRRKTKAQRVYHAYLLVSDVYRSLSFKEFLTDPYYADARTKA